MQRRDCEEKGKREDETCQDWGTLDSREYEIGELQYTKVQVESNPADLMTKNVHRRTLDKMAALLQQHFKGGRAENSLHLQTASGRDQPRRRRSATISSTWWSELEAYGCVVPPLFHFLQLSLMVFPFLTSCVHLIILPTHSRWLKCCCVIPKIVVCVTYLL